MYPHAPTALLVITLLYSLATTTPINHQPSLPSSLLTPSLPKPASLNDWEHFTYPLPRTPFILKGRIFTSKPLLPSALHTALSGVLDYAQTQVSALGPEARLPTRNIAYRIPGSGRSDGCFLKLMSTMDREGPVMTWGMVRDILLGLREVLEKGERRFETSFVVVDEGGRSWGHGEIMEKTPVVGVGEQ